MNIICLIFGHKFSNWIFIKSIGRYDDMLKRTCNRCNIEDYYRGLTKTTKSGKKIPHSKLN